VLSGREVCALLAEHGFVEVRHRGSHVVMQRREASGTTTVPVPDHKELRSAAVDHSAVRSSAQPV
jgi:predicted RNA binding protein YcfA (HicA-like mRNA interferase family)